MTCIAILHRFYPQVTGQSIISVIPLWMYYVSIL